MSKVAESSVEDGPGLLKRLGWHQLELRLADDNMGGGIAATAVWFQIHPAQPAGVHTPFTAPAQLEWTSASDTDHKFVHAAFWQSSTAKSVAGAKEVQAVEFGKQVKKNFLEPALLGQITKM